MAESKDPVKIDPMLNPHDSAATKAENAEKRVLGEENIHETNRIGKRVKTEADFYENEEAGTVSRKKGVAPVKAEYLINGQGDSFANGHVRQTEDLADRDESAEQSGKKRKKQKSKGQNTNRTFGFSKDAIPLCMSRAKAPEFSPASCEYGDSCKFEHDLRRYLREGKRQDLDTFDGRCPVFDARGWCSAGWKCRFAKAHSMERLHEDGSNELILLQNDAKVQLNEREDAFDEGVGVVNIVPATEKIALRKHKRPTPQADRYTDWLNAMARESTGSHQQDKSRGVTGTKTDVEDNRAAFKDPPFLPSEKRRLYYGPETPVLAPLTTQGNLPFRRLCVELGAQVTWSEMAMGLPLLQGEKAEWALMKAHESELTPPNFSPKGNPAQVYDNSKDLKFGAQIAGNKPWVALKATQVLTELCPHLRAIDLNCGCPIDLVFSQGAGSALLDNPGKLEKILRGMNAVSGDVPITAKIRTGVKDGSPTAERLIERLAFGGVESRNLDHGPPGVAAVTLHGRSRQQRYTKSADWEYIAQCSALIKGYHEQRDDKADTIREPEERDISASRDGKMYFIGNGDCYSHEDYFSHIKQAGVDSVMVARGALIKPWIFEEIEKGQYLDKSAKERLEYIEKFSKYGLETWGSDEVGVGTTRRFLLEWLSFSCRYVPIGLLEYLPPRIQDRPPAYRSRDDLETLLGSDNYKDWIKISEMFLGPAHKDFHFEPKHKSNSYDTEG